MGKRYAGIALGALLGEEHHDLMFGPEEKYGQAGLLHDYNQHLRKERPDEKGPVTSLTASPDFVGYFILSGGAEMLAHYKEMGFTDGELGVTVLDPASPEARAFEGLHLGGLCREAMERWKDFGSFCARNGGPAFKSKLLFVVDED